jgi:NAD(P)H-quinone oxidoreductase subunit 4L
MMVGLAHYLVLAAALFSIGVWGVLTRRNAIGVLMSLELMFNAVNINLVAFGRFLAPGHLTGQVFAVFVITIAAAEATIGLAIVLLLFRRFGRISVDEINLLKG